MLTGGQLWHDKISVDDVTIISHLINVAKSSLKSPKRSSSKKSDQENADNDIEIFDHYIYETFHCFSQNKKQIIFDLDQLNEVKDKKMTDLIMHSLDGVDIDKGEKEKKRADGDLSHLFREELFLIFKNVKSVIIITTGGYPSGSRSYSLSLYGLLSLIHSISVLDEVIVKAVTYKQRENKYDRNSKVINKYNWIYSLWSSSSKKMKQEYGAKNYTISLREVESKGLHDDDVQEYWFIINKKD